jgi:uncharacterized protein (DUF1501 family)
MSSPARSGPPDCCTDFAEAGRLSRRRFMAGMAATSAAAVSTTMFGDAFRQTSYASTPGTGGNVLVVISLRGGIDGLGMVVPHGDPAYYRARPNIALPKSTLLARDAMFGLHPKLAPLEWLWKTGELAAVHATGLKVPNRSHFSAMEEVEDADTGSVTRRGWVNRMIGLDARADPSEAIHLTSSVVPTMMSGTAPALAAGGLDEISLSGDDQVEWAQRRRTGLGMVWAGGTGVGLYDAYRSAIRTVDVLAPATGKAYTPAVAYPTSWPGSDLADALKDTARLIKADVGTDVVSIDYGTWDMHSDYGTTAWGHMQDMTAGFAGGLDAFMRDLGTTLRKRVTVVTISEFGRRTKENGNGGLDHGWGNMMLVAGGGVKGGKYYSRWPGLGTGTQVDDDLQVTTDYRDVFGEIITRRFPGRSLATVFPGLKPAPLGLMA